MEAGRYPARVSNSTPPPLPRAPETRLARRAARRALTRALLDAARTPFDLADYLINRGVHERSVRADLAGFAAQPTQPPAAQWPERPLRVFIGCAEPSGELHAESVIRELQGLAHEAGAPEPQLTGFGGERLEALGVQRLGDPTARASMGFEGSLGGVPYYMGLVRHAAEAFAGGCDLFLPVDSPALFVPIAHVARRAAVSTVHFVTPQYWGWAPWRVRGYSRCIERALTILPFEPAWFERNHVRTAHVGHPLMDRLVDVEQRDPSSPSSVLAILPGSREGVIARNLPWMLDAVRPLAEQVDGLVVQVLQADKRHTDLIRATLARAGLDSSSDGRPAFRAELVVGDVHAALRRARAAFSVSGTVLIDLLHHRLPTVVVYKLTGPVQHWMQKHLLTTPWFASPNLLAGEQVLPEFAFHGSGPQEEIGAALTRCYKDGAWRTSCEARLERAARRLGPAGAARRAALHALDVAAGSTRSKT